MGAILGFSVRQLAGIAALGLSAALTLHACGKDKKEEGGGVVFDPALAGVEITAKTVSDADGVITATIDYTSSNTQLVKASESSRITGTTLSFPPGSFDIDFDVSLEEGKSIATKANLATLINGEGILLSSASSVVVTWTYDQDTFSPFKLMIPAPTPPVPLPGDATLVILTMKNQVDKPKRLLGLMTAANFTAADGFLTFTSSSYGAFQAVYVRGSPGTVTGVETDDKQQGIGKISGVKPGEFQVAVPTAAIAGAKDVLSWDPAELADTYIVKLDQTSAACVAPYYSGSVKALSLAMTNAKNGDSFVCVTAVNLAGETAATNSGLKLSADVAAPPVPAKPTTNGPVIHTIEPQFSWDAVTDAGPSGLAYYQVEIGTSAGAADVFNGPVTTTTKNVIGFHGKTYYIRVSAVDGAGNASAFSPGSDGVLVDTE